MLLPLSLGLLVLVLVMAGNFVYWAINSVVNQGMGLAPVLRLFILAVPGFAVQGIPAGTILGVCLVLNRAVRDNEILALRGAGASVARIIMPFMVVALLASFADWAIVEKVAPRTNAKAEKSMARLISQSTAPLIETDKYFRVGNYYFYVGKVEHRDTAPILRNVMIYERQSGPLSNFAPAVFPTVRIAASAQEVPPGSGRWRLDNVVQHNYADDGTQRAEAHMDRVYIDVGAQLSTFWATQKAPFSMTGDEITERIHDLANSASDGSQLNTLRVDYYRRYALPAACFVMALLAAPLALKYARHGSFAGLVSAFLLAFLWQGCDGWLRALGIAGYIGPLVAAWSTNALFLVAGAILLWRER
jgi:lipopolysaccharide export LptBFGC system permease protein LptF